MFRDFKKYEVFDDGRVYSYHSKKFLKPDKNRGGYYLLRLYDNNGKNKSYQVHRVVYESIKGEIPEGLQVNHIDEDKSNNSISNLNLMTPKENTNWGTGIQRLAEKLTNRQDKSKQVAAYQNGVLVMVFQSTREADRQGFNHGAVASCCRNCYLREGNNIYKGYTWIYFEEFPPLFI